MTPSVEQNTTVFNIATIQECSAASFESNMPFPEVVHRLIEAGVERYHTDLIRQSKTYHGRVFGQYHLQPFPDFSAVEVPETFSEAVVKETIQAIQRREIGYREFLRRIMAAGTASYDVFLTGRNAIYIGRKGDFHVEAFPAAR